ncbi:MAG: IS701 family transposase [Candidatus Angelobacter sp.]
MPTLPEPDDSLIQAFAPHFSNCIWQYAQVLLLGAILAPGRRTVTAALRIMGLSQERQFQTYHRVLNRAVWSSWALSRTLLKLLVQTFVPTGPIVCALDPTIERRRGAKIKAKGIYRDPVRSSHSHFVKASGLRWISLMLLAPIPWAGRVWALPFLTCLAPSERYYEGKVRGHKKVLDWGRQMILQLRRWLPQRKLVVVADSEFAAILWLFGLTQLPGELCLIVRLRLDAALYQPAPQRTAQTKGRPRKKGERLPTLEQVAADPKTCWQHVTIRNWYGEGRRVIEIVSQTAVWFHNGLPALPMRWVLIRDPKGKFKTQALLCTDRKCDPVQIVKWFILRWQVEVTYHEVREHLGVETQRQWSDLAILRTTPVLLGLFSLVTLLAHQHTRRRKLPIRQTAWYHKTQPTFSDALALVRQQIWQQSLFQMTTAHTDSPKLLAQIQNRLLSALCYTP